MTLRVKLIILITLLAAFFRFWGLGTNPPALNWDEIAIGYNAYSILHTGRDEYNTFLPTTFRSFEDYKSPLYIYLVVPCLALFGKTEFAIRLPSALFGTLTIPAIYLLILELLSKKNLNIQQFNHTIHKIRNIAVIGSFLLAITPWHIHFSRVAFEANLGLFFTVLGVYLLLYWLRSSKKLHLIAATFSVSLAIHSYANMRLFIPLIMIVIASQQIYKFKLYWKQVLVASILGLILISPLIMQLYQGIGLARYQATSLVNRPNIYTQNIYRAVQETAQGRPLVAKFIFNPRISILAAFSESYFSHFTFDFLFRQTKPDRTRIPGVGLIYLWQLPLIIIGLGVIFKTRNNFSYYPTILWLLLAPIPAALTWDTPHAIRTEIILVPFTILSAIGLWSILKFIQHLEIKNYRTFESRSNAYKASTWLTPKFVILAIFITITLSTMRMWLNYQTQLPFEFAATWLYGRKEMVQFVMPQKDQYKDIKVSSSLEWSYLWFLWYGNLDPQHYLNNGGTKSGSFAFEGNQIDNIYFQNFDYTKDSYQHTGTLYIGTPQDFPPKFTPGQVIETKDGQKLIYIVRS